MAANKQGEPQNLSQPKLLSYQMGQPLGNLLKTTFYSSTASGSQTLQVTRQFSAPPSEQGRTGAPSTCSQPRYGMLASSEHEAASRGSWKLVSPQPANNGSTRGQMTFARYPGFLTPSLPLSVPNPRKIPSYGQNLANTLPPTRTRRHMYMPPE